MATQFDRDEWLFKLKDDWTKMKGRGYGRSKEYNSHKRAITELGKVVSWLGRKGYTVEFKFGAEPALHPDDEWGMIHINKTNPPRTQLYILLHEVGHLLLSRTRGYKERFSKGYPWSTVKQRAKRALRSHVHRSMIMSEECAAWDAGLKHARKLGIEIDREKFDQCRALCLASYARWWAELDDD